MSSIPVIKFFQFLVKSKAISLEKNIISKNYVKVMKKIDPNSKN